MLSMVVRATLCEIVSDGKILFMHRSSDFGKGKWNGPGGKIEPDETPLECVIREVYEETGLTIRDPKLMGETTFYFNNHEEADWIVYIYLATDFSGELTEGDEGTLKWFSLDEIPYDELWQDDEYWLPWLLDGRPFIGHFWYDVKEKLVRHTLVDYEG